MIFFALYNIISMPRYNWFLGQLINSYYLRSRCEWNAKQCQKVENSKLTHFSIGAGKERWMVNYLNIQLQ